ncbi:TPA: AAA family ATPase [Yersinia enterocolitica]|uniref:AAA family ATPase n=1 Tax=Yersinia enterocolitica TaxID=630 RepID=UPI001F568C10|nr:AAA family ATPase [Yersinia enterocolitica]HDL6522579.1 AAA family ATPase [Yersinia enterocolitica]HDZ9661281.1 AAA family ATPase [Yersinia enterocolitica]HEM6602674.1 AAA family ATPase [Yersinia enterocolitica]HEN3537396.1 AAA family ATPase [Yersinia enterocolitica]
MINRIDIQGFKSIDNEFLKLAPLTILTGTNSSGKSTVIQALLLIFKNSVHMNRFSMDEITRYLSDFSSIRNKNTNAREINLSVETTNKENISLRISSTDILFNPSELYVYESNSDEVKPEFFYLNANRIGPQEQVTVTERKVGNSAEFIFNYFEKVKRNPLSEGLVYFEGSSTIDFQVSKWLSYITETESKLVTEQVSTNHINISFDMGGIKDISPLNLGSGISYVTKVIILCLIAKKGDLIIIENPEIHLHPKAQAQLGVFLAFIANSGIQLIIETHCEHLINKIAYQIYNDKIPDKNVVIHYKGSVNEAFQTINIDENGEFNNEHGCIISFPKGFFDATLANLMEMR